MLVRLFSTRLGRALAIYDRWVAESHVRSLESVRLLHRAREQFDAARSVRSDRVPWCARCGERLCLPGCAGRDLDGIHARCRP
jgi:hypothetical protein